MMNAFYMQQSPMLWQAIQKHYNLYLSCLGFVSNLYIFIHLEVFYF